ncbi:MAG: SixA phosphatase family protein [Allosphingosinicella sp.]|uniref:SixA phosphatase family protein n=1 Tax=Allosphingosinicella sp. TaxID=2823234 RepID=UPI003953970C
MLVAHLPIPLLAAMCALLSLGGCATAGRPAADAAPAFYVMRHLHTPQGERDPDLTAEGQAAAERLPARLAAHPPRAIYVTQWKRTQQTAAPVAARLGLTPIRYDAADLDGLVARARAERGPVLIVGHSNTVPDIIGRLGGVRPADLSHPDFGDVWIIHPDGRTETAD